jgi:hypothetical protein
MATRIYVKLQKPTIEMVVKATDASGTSDRLVVGFKRYDNKEATLKLQELQKIQNELYAHAMKDLAEQYKHLGEDAPKSETPLLSKEQAELALKNFVCNEIVYLKDIQNLTLQDESGKEIELKVADTRTAKPNEPLWGTSEECLSVLVDLYFDSNPYRGSLIQAQQKALANVDLKDGEIKN